MKAAKEVTIGMPMGGCFIVMRCVVCKQRDDYFRGSAFRGSSASERTVVQSGVIFRECKSQNCQCFLIWYLKERIWSSLPGEQRASMLAPDRDKIGTGLGCQPASSGRVAQCPGCWPKRLAWHSPCVHSRRAKWKKKIPETLFQAHGIQWPVDAEPFVRHRLSAVWCGGETGKPVVGNARAG